MADKRYWDAECCRLTAGCEEAPGHSCCLDEAGRCEHGRED